MSKREDLLALATEDLYTLTNRGTVKRAQKEISEGKVNGIFSEEDDGSVEVSWSDDIKCSFPGGKTLREALCTCPSTQLCRHIIRSVLAYQKNNSATSDVSDTLDTSNTSDTAEASKFEAWSPGEISEESLADIFPARSLKQWQKDFQDNYLVELFISDKPQAHFHLRVVTIRFIVPMDPRYVHCDCETEGPCSHIAMAVWAFRLFSSEKKTGLVVSPSLLSTEKYPLHLLNKTEEVLEELWADGISHLAPTWLGRWQKIQESMEEGGLVWPAEIMRQVEQQFEKYQKRDALFDPQFCTRLIGELLIRSDALQNYTKKIPVPFITGSQGTQFNKMGGSRLVGLGTLVSSHKKSVSLSCFFQESRTGKIISIEKVFSDPLDTSAPLPSFRELGEGIFSQGGTFFSLGQGQLLLKGGKCHTDGRLTLGRSRHTLHPQSYTWENLRFPLGQSSFEEVLSLLGSKPPLSLCNRSVGESFVVWKIAGVSGAQFIESEQLVWAELKDEEGKSAFLTHPYTQRGSEGVEALLDLLTKEGDKISFIAGVVKLTFAGLTIFPTALIWETKKGRKMLQPWLARSPLKSQSVFNKQPGFHENLNYPSQIISALSEILLLGLRHLDLTHIKIWNELYQEGAALGFYQLAKKVETLSKQLEGKLHNCGRKEPVQAISELALLSKLAEEVG